MPMHEIDVPVLIVGGGPTGLCASLLLSRHGVRSLLVDRKPRTSEHPKARGVNVRTLELFRVWGVEQAVRAAVGKSDRPLDVVWVPTLVAPETRRMPYGGAAERFSADSPTTSADCPQEKLEPVLLEAARSSGLGKVLFGQELTQLDQSGDEVTATIVDRSTREASIVRADWVIAADGAQSTVRSLLGIDMIGPGALFHRMAISFRADLRDVVGNRAAWMYIVAAPGGTGPMGQVDVDNNLWRYQADYDPEHGERAEDFPTDRCVQLVRDAVGIHDVEVEVLSAEPWSGAAAVAERFRDRRVILAGDAAHHIGPAGGQGMCVGIQGVHNLVWKLAGHIHGWAGLGLVDTYDAERRPFALAVNDDVARNMAAGPGAPRPEQFSNRGRVLGVSYTSSAVIPDGSDLPPVANSVIDYVPTARPGSRAPHMWLSQGGKQVSTLDLFDTDFVLLAGPAGDAWCSGGREVADGCGIPVRSYKVGPAGPLMDASGEWPRLYGVEPDGAVLMRPDGHVAWRSRTTNAAAVSHLAEVFRRILHWSDSGNEGSRT